MVNKNIYERLHEIQQKLIAPKARLNAFGKYKYRSCEDILNAVKPLLNGLVLTLTDKIIQVDSRIYVEATATLSDGSSNIQTTAYARESLDKKGMDDSQITGSTSSYARKFALNGLLCIDDNKDADHQDNTTVPARAAKAAEAHKKKTAVRYMKAKFDGTCALSGKPIKIGDDVAYNPATKKASLVEAYEAFKADKELEEESKSAEVENDTIEM